MKGGWEEEGVRIGTYPKHLNLFLILFYLVKINKFFFLNLDVDVTFFNAK